MELLKYLFIVYLAGTMQTAIQRKLGNHFRLSLWAHDAEPIYYNHIVDVFKIEKRASQLG